MAAMKLLPPCVLPLLWLLLVAGCATPNQTADFAANQLLYVDVPFKTKAPGDRSLFVAPIQDVRDQQALPTSERGFPIAYGGDDFWDRPIGEMLGDVLARQLENSGLFTAVTTEAGPDTLVLKPTLVAFTTGQTEAVSGSRSFAEVSLRLQVLGPADAAGKRAVVHDQTCTNRQLSTLELNPVSPYRLVGRALQLTMSKALASLDGSNIGRSHVPSVATAEATVETAPLGPTTPAAPVRD